MFACKRNPAESPAVGNAPPAQPKLLGRLLILLSLSWLFIIPLLPLDGNREVAAAWLDAGNADHALVFFGYPGCAAVCPPAMHAMGQVYDTVADEKERKRLNLVFANLQITSSAETAAAYTRRFHPAFRVYQPASSGELQSVLRELGATAVARGGRIDHSGYVYLLQRTQDGWIIRHVYRDADEILRRAVQDLRKLSRT